MEDLWSAVNAAKEQRDRQQAEDAERNKIQEERAQARRLRDETETSERAQKFLTIMRAKNMPQTGAYLEEREHIWYDAWGYRKREVLGPKGEPYLLGWVAIQELVRTDSSGELEFVPGAFVAPDGQTYDCDAQRRSPDGVLYVTRAEPNATTLTGDDRWRGMVQELVRQGIAN